MVNDTSLHVWFPPNDADPKAVLREAMRDARHGRFEAALAKYVWFYTDISVRNPGLRSARSTSCLIGWAMLSQRFPRAKQELFNYRDQLRDHIFGEMNSESDLNHFIVINYLIDQDVVSSELFLLIEGQNSERAKSIYCSFEDALVQTGHFKTCLKYFDAEESYLAASTTYKVQVSYADSLEAGSRVRRETGNIAIRMLTYKLGIAALLLAVGNNQDKAEALILKAQHELGLEEECCEQLWNATLGTIPSHPIERLPL